MQPEAHIFKEPHVGLDAAAGEKFTNYGDFRGITRRGRAELSKESTHSVPSRRRGRDFKSSQCLHHQCVDALNVEAKPPLIAGPQPRRPGARVSLPSRTPARPSLVSAGVLTEVMSALS